MYFSCSLVGILFSFLSSSSQWISVSFKRAEKAASDIGLLICFGLCFFSVLKGNYIFKSNVFVCKWFDLISLAIIKHLTNKIISALITIGWLRVVWVLKSNWLILFDKKNGLTLVKSLVLVMWKSIDCGLVLCNFCWYLRSLVEKFVLNKSSNQIVCPCVRKTINFGKRVKTIRYLKSQGFILLFGANRLGTGLWSVKNVKN